MFGLRILAFFLFYTVIRVESASSTTSLLGNVYNFWSTTGNGVDLTRGKGNGTSIVTNDKSGKSPILISPGQSALVIIDMQNYFLHPALSSSSLGRDLVPTQISMINAFRANGMKVLWVQWGLTENDIITMAPNLLYSFGDGQANQTFGTEMGTVQDGNTTIDMGKKLARGSWNAQAWGDLLEVQTAGIAAGTDFYFNKSDRLSGLWGAQTPLGMFLEDQGITTLFFGGVNTDQCVYGTLLDASYKGYDTILVPDISATSSPSSVNAMVYFNSAGIGWVTNSTEVLSALK